MQLIRPQPHLLIGAMLAFALVAGLYVIRASAAPAAPEGSRVVVKTVKNTKLGEQILVDLKGLTLYSLSAEKNGRFICTDAFCRSLWTPLVVARGTKPAGAHLLATVRRPDGRTQVTYKGLPLYTFTMDKKPGDTKGNGFTDVGTWRPATPTGSSKASAPSGNPYRY